ncbi:hypothetical protein Bca4012_064298 [Brassica carinata]|uniref:Uncharacterized protein n=1 Tax=Brassica carinata TaxID=52824 RepID=A0A8X7SDP4_BRACI|nr:hypothetical protein Bca52824_033875 [Brassica carinata]
MEIDPASLEKAVSLTVSSENLVQQNDDPAGTYVLGLAAVFKDRPITISNSFSSLLASGSSSNNHTSLNPFALPKSLPSQLSLLPPLLLFSLNHPILQKLTPLQLPHIPPLLPPLSPLSP